MSAHTSQRKQTARRAPSNRNALEIAFGSLDDPDGVDADEDGGDAGHDAERKDAEQAEDQGFPGAVIGGPRVELGIGRRRQTGYWTR